MDTPVGRETDPVEFLAALADAPYRYDFYQTLRRLEGLYRNQPRWGEAKRPVDEPVRLGQAPDLSFAPASLASFTHEAGQRPKLQVRLFGLLGPNGPMPLHITEYARERLIHAGDPTLVRFLDIFHHRFLSFFYRAWAQAQPHVNRDRPESDRFAAYIGAFMGLEQPSLRHRDTTPDAAKLFHAGAFIRQVRNAEGLGAILEHFFRIPVQIEQFVGQWLGLAAGERTTLGRAGTRLGSEAVLGGRVWDRQHKFRIHLGPLTLDQYQSFLPVQPDGEAGGAAPLRKLRDWVRIYLCFELDWDVRLRLAAAAVPALRLGVTGQLGWTSWLGRRGGSSDASDLCLDAEGFFNRVEGSAA